MKYRKLFTIRIYQDYFAYKCLDGELGLSFNPGITTDEELCIADQIEAMARGWA